MKKIYLLSVACLIFMSCQKEQTIELPDFEVQTTSAEVKLGEKVNFSFSGNPDFINFYSGERGNDYNFREGRIEESEVFLSFESQIVDNRTPASTQGNQISVLISNNFNGNQTIADVEQADWTDITSQFRMAQLSENNTNIPSGKVNISPYLEEGKATYIAFKYTTKPRSTYGVAPNFNRIRSFLLESISNGQASTLATHATAGITSPKGLIRSATYQAGRGTLESTYINFYGNVSPSQDDVLTTAWVTTNAFNIGKKVDLGIDKAVSIKTVADVMVKTYSHIYKNPGKYRVVFVAKNANVYDEKTVLKQIDITVLP